MQKRFITNIALLILLNLLIKPFWIFGIDRTVQNIVGAEAYGFYFSLLNVSFLFNIFLDVGITNFNNRNIAQNNQLLNKHFSGIVVIKFLLSFLYLALTLIFSLIVGYTKAQITLLLILCGNQFLASFILYFRSNITGLQLFKTDSILSVLDRLLMIGICSVLIWGNITEKLFRIEWFVYAQTASYFLTFLTAGAIVVRKAAFKKIRWHVPFYLMIFKKSLPFAVLILLMFFYYRIDGVMLERMLPNGAFETGVYAAAFRLLDAAFMMAHLFPVILLPTFSFMLKRNESIIGLFKLSYTLMMITAVSFGIAAFFFRFEIMDLLYHDNVALSARVFGVLMLCFVAIASGSITSTLLTANGNLKYLNILAFSGMVLNIVLNFVMIPHLKALGSAYASLFTQLLISSLQLALVCFIFKFKPNYKLILSFVAFFTTVILLGMASKHVEFNWLATFVGLIVLSFLTAFVLRLIKIKEILHGFRNK